MRYGYTKYGVTPCSLAHRYLSSGKTYSPRKAIGCHLPTKLHGVTCHKTTVNLLKPQHNVQLVLCLMVPDMGKRVRSFEGFLGFPACPSDNSSINIKISTEQYVTCNLKPQIHQNNK